MGHARYLIAQLQRKGGGALSLASRGCVLRSIDEHCGHDRDNLPSHIGPCEIGQLGKLIAVRCPRDFDDVMRRAGGQWEPGSRRWLVEPRRIGPVIRALRRVTDTLFRRAGVSLE
jgi:hypothetical protein